MSKKFMRTLGDGIDRRTVLRKTATVLGSLLVGIVGLEREVAATVHVFCCNLCVDPATCTYSCPPEREWSWVCGWIIDCAILRCKECFAEGYTPAGNTCVGVVCSMWEKAGHIGPPCVPR